MAALWASKDPQEWEQQLQGYKAAVQQLGRISKEGKTLEELDSWFHDALPEMLSSRAESGPAQISKEELVKLVDWKLTHGKWRPRLLGFAKDLPAGAAEAASQAAFALLAPHRGGKPPAPEGVIKQALDALTVLKGVGPATASAVLEAFDPSIPFLSDEAMQAALGSKDYKVKDVQRLTAALRKRAEQLSKDSGRQWSAKEVEMCLFVNAVSRREAGSSAGSSKGGGSKGKARAAAAAEGEGGSSKKRKP